MTVRHHLANAAAAGVSALPSGVVRTLASRSDKRLALALNRALKRKPRAYDAVPTSLGFAVDGHTSDLIQRYLYVFGIWEPNITHWLRDHLRPGDVVVDIGANIGYFSLLAGERVGTTGRVLAFEAVPSIADMLQRNVDRSGFPIEVHREAVSDAPGTLEIFRSEGTNIGKSGTVGTGTSISEGLVPAVRGTDAVPRDLWPRIRFIKVDVEGDERRVVRGLEPLLTELSPGAAVFVEVSPHDLEARGESASELLGTMQRMGFEAHQVHNSYKAADYARFTRQPPTPLLNVPTDQIDVLFIKGEV